MREHLGSVQECRHGVCMCFFLCARVCVCAWRARACLSVFVYVSMYLLLRFFGFSFSSIFSPYPTFASFGGCARVRWDHSSQWTWTLVPFLFLIFQSIG